MIFVAMPSVPSEPTKTPSQIVAGRVERFAAEVDQRAVGQNDFEAEDVRGGEAVFQAVRAAGVFRDVAADAAHGLRRGIGRVEVICGARRGR